MKDSVAQLRARWTPETTEAAVRFLQRNPTGVDIPTMELDGEIYLDLRGIRIEQTQLDGMLIRNVNLRWSTIRDVGFKSAKLVNCNLSQATFSECYFRRAVFQECDIVNSRFDACEFSNAHLEASRLDFATFRGCEIGIENIAFRGDTTPQVLARVCRNLKLNAMSMGHYDDASELTFLEKSHERRVLFQQVFSPGRERSVKRFKAFARWLDSSVLNWLWGYGEKPWRLLLSMIVAIVAFGTVQYWLDGVPGEGWWEHQYFSGITFFTIGYGDLRPVELLPRMLSVIEGFVGITFIGMLIASLTKKIMHR